MLSWNSSRSFTDESRIEAEGQKDGERNIPDMGSYQPAQFEQALVAHGEQEVQQVYEIASQRIAKLQPGFEAAQIHLADLESRFNGVVNAYKARKSELGRDFAGRFPHKYHIMLIILLAVGEFPLNTIVFRLFGEPEFLTYVMASTLAITIPLLGLFIGIHLRQSMPAVASNILIGLLTPISAGAALYSISQLRNTYIVSQSAAFAAADAVPMNQDELAYALFALNALVFCAAMVSAFFSHDPDETLDSGHSALVHLDRRVNKIRKRHLTVGTRINGEIRRAKSRIEQVRALTHQRVALYRGSNVRFRRLLPPPSFRRDPEFRELEWWPEVVLHTKNGSS